MIDCSRCEENKTDLVKCEGCNQPVCSECCVEITSHNMIDFPFCKNCEDLNKMYN